MRDRPCTVAALVRAGAQEPPAGAVSAVAAGAVAPPFTSPIAHPSARRPPLSPPLVAFARPGAYAGPVTPEESRGFWWAERIFAFVGVLTLALLLLLLLGWV